MHDKEKTALSSPPRELEVKEEVEESTSIGSSGSQSSSTSVTVTAGSSIVSQSSNTSVNFPLSSLYLFDSRRSVSQSSSTSVNIERPLSPGQVAQLNSKSSVSQSSSTSVSSEHPLPHNLVALDLSSASQRSNTSVKSEGLVSLISAAHLGGRSSVSQSRSTSVSPELPLLALATAAAEEAGNIPSVISDDSPPRYQQSSVKSGSLAQRVSLIESVCPTKSDSEPVCSAKPSVGECVVSAPNVTDIVRGYRESIYSSRDKSLAPAVQKESSNHHQTQQNGLSNNHQALQNGSSNHHQSLGTMCVLDPSVGSDSAMEDCGDSSEEDMVIDAKDIKQEVDSEAEDGEGRGRQQGQDTVDGGPMLHASLLETLQNIDLKLEDDEDSNSSCSLSISLSQQESDASKRKRLVNSLSQSFPHSALYSMMHSMDTQALDTDDEELVPSAERLSSSCFSSLRMDKVDDDDDLTSLSWLQDTDLLKNLNPQINDISDEYKENADSSQKSGETVTGGFVPQAHPHHVPYNPMKHINSKPPYSFSCLIFMAVEATPSKKLPVKDIYNWILTNFPYFRNAPTGWKNSVRHNLSLNKCFKKVEKDKGANIGKGSLWCIDPEYRPNLLQALRKTPYSPYQQLQMMSTLVPQQNVHHLHGVPASALRPMPLTQRPVPNTVSPYLFPYLSRRLAQTSVDRETHDCANVLLAMSSKSSGKSSDGADDNSSRNKRNPFGPPKRQGPFIITPNPSSEHNYSSTKILQEDAISGTSSIDNEYDFGDDDDDISEPSDYPSDWDETSGDEVDGDVPQEPAHKRPRLGDSGGPSSAPVIDEEEGALLLMSLSAGLSSYTDVDRCPPAKSPSSACMQQPRSSSTMPSAAAAAKPRRSASASPLNVAGKKRSASTAFKSSSLSSSQSSTSSRSSNTKSKAKPVSRSALKTKLNSKASSPKSAKSSGRSSASKSLKTAGASTSKSKSTGSTPSSSVKTSSAKSSSSKMSASKSSASPSSSSSSVKMSSSVSSSPSSSTSSLKMADLTPPASAKQAMSLTPDSSAKSSAASTPSSNKKSSIIMTRRAKMREAAESARKIAIEMANAAEMASAAEMIKAVEMAKAAEMSKDAEMAKAASSTPPPAAAAAASPPNSVTSLAVHRMRTRGKKLKYP